jgi:hypothetical protein
MDSNLLKLLVPVAVCHALGHVTSNVSFAAVAVSFTHTIKGDRKFDALAQILPVLKKKKKTSFFH